jgi:hypothetical protein
VTSWTRGPLPGTGAARIRSGLRRADYRREARDRHASWRSATGLCPTGYTSFPARRTGCGAMRAEREAARAVGDAVPHDDPLRGLLEAVLGLTAALEAAEVRVGTDYADRLARAAALGAQQHALALVRGQMRRHQAILAALFALVGLAGVALGWLLAGR